MTHLRWSLIIVLGSWLGFGCGSDINWPDVMTVEAMQGDTLVEELDLSELSEDAFEGDMPVDVYFRIVFDETMDMTTAEENIWIEGLDRTPIEGGVALTARLEVITVTPTPTAGQLNPGENHVLHIGDDIEDVNGHELLTGHDVSFYTAP